MSRGVSLCILPLLLRLSPGVLAALARSRNARMACGVVGAVLRDGSGLVAGPPLGVLAVPGVRTSGVRLLPGVGPALAARRKGVLGCRRALGVVCTARSGDGRCFFRAESDMLWRRRSVGRYVDALQGNASWVALLASVELVLSITPTATLFLLHQIARNNYTMSDHGSDGGIPLIEEEFDITTSSKKRKAEAEPAASKESRKAAKKLKWKEKKKQRAKAIDEDDLDQELGVNHSFERMDGQLLADYINSRTRLYGRELSSVELEDKFISGKFAVHTRSHI
jgi:hypothetical protein